jgi:hypothetical protein
VTTPETEALILRQAEEIKARHAAQVENRDLDAEIERAKAYGTEAQVELLTALRDDRAPEFGAPPATQSGAMVPPDQVFDAATHQPVGGVPEAPSVDADEPVRETDEDVAPYEEWSKSDLQSEVDVRNAHGSSIARSGTIAELAERLRQDDQS